ncbi:unnamed protein product, partial [Iphiclides podalirius]
MGKSYSKEEEVVVQNGSQVESYNAQQSMLLVAIATCLAIITIYVVWRSCRNHAKDWLRKQVHAVNAAPPVIHVQQPTTVPQVAVSTPQPAAAAVY